MKKSIFYMGVLAILAACQQEKELVPEETVSAGPVILSATVEDNDVKATITEETGAFAFSANDQILIWNGTMGYYGTTSQGGTKADFTMDNGFDPKLKGFAAFPSDKASVPNANKVDFTLPQEYIFEEVGSISDESILSGLQNVNYPVGPDNGKVPCPMIAFYNGDGKLNFRHVGALIRFRITNTSADTGTKALENLIFTFTTPVTGDFSMDSVPTGPDEGVHASNITKYAGYSITVKNVPKTNAGQYVYITLPVPVDTDPNNVSIFQVADRRITKTLHGTPVSLKRACGYKVGTSLELDPLSSFGGHQIAGYLHYGQNAHYGAEIDYEIYPYHYWSELPKGHGKNTHYFEYENIQHENDPYYSSYFTQLCTTEGKDIRYSDYGTIKVRIPGGNGSEWRKIIGLYDVERRPGATVYGTGGVHKGVHYAYVTVRNYNGSGNHCYGLLLFPDNAIITTELIGYHNIQITKFDELSSVSTSGDQGNYVTSSEMRRLTDQGCFFLPAGYADAYDANGQYQNDGYYVKAPLSEGRYWTATHNHETYDNEWHLFYMSFSDTQLPTDIESKFQWVGDNYFGVVLIKAD